MERWDFNCQKCGRNIGDSYYVDPEWYQCSQDRGEYPKLEKVFLDHLMAREGVEFDKTGKIISGSLPKNEKIVKDLKNAISIYMEEKDVRRAAYLGRFYIYLDFEKRKAWWSPEAGDSVFSDSNYQRAKLIKHEVEGSGRGRLGYCFCVKCVEEGNLGYKCPKCRSELVKVTAGQHPGGHWGIRGVREPAPMR